MNRSSRARAFKTTQVLENYEAGESVDEIAYNFDLRPHDIEGVLRSER